MIDSPSNYNEKPLRCSISAFLLALAAVLFPAPLSAQSVGKITVLVNAFENQSGDRSIDWIGEGMAQLVSERLTAQPQLYVFGRDERVAEYERIGIPETVSVSRATNLKIAWDIGADVVLAGWIEGTHENFRIGARVLNVGDSSMGDVAAISGKLDDVISMAASLSSQLAREIVPGSVLPESDYAARPPVPRSAFEAYVRAMLASDPQRRLDLLKDAIRLHPQYFAAIYQLGRTYYLDSDYKASTEMLEKVPVAASEHPQARFMLGMNYYHLGDQARSAAAFAALPAVYDVLVNLGAALLGKGDTAGAESAWRRAAALDASRPEAAFNLAHLAFTLNQTDTAARRLTQYLRSRGRDAEALLLLGRVYERQGRAADSQRVTTQALSLSPRLSRWNNQPLPSFVRLRAQFNATEVRLPPDAGLWTEPRRARKSTGQDLVDALSAPLH